MIPKIIHYCWFGGNPLPDSAHKCINSWKKYFPDYEIKEWNEKNFDVNMIPYTQEAYRMKKYAFVSDFARLYVIMKYGGLYFDTDVEVIKPMDDIVSKGAFLGVEKNIIVEGMNIPGINPGLGFGAPENHPYFIEMVELYKKMDFYHGNGNTYGFKTIVENCTEVMMKYGYNETLDMSVINKIRETYLYPKEYFCPNFYNGKWIPGSNTRSIHHYAATWLPKSILFKVWLVKKIPQSWYSLYKKFSSFIHNLL